MNENPIASSVSVSSTTQSGTGCLGQIGWLFSGFVMPLGSFTFYRQAARKSVGGAILFFLVFTLTISLLASLGIGKTLLSVGAEIKTAFEDGTIPKIVIRDGLAEVEGRQPSILVDEFDRTGSRDRKSVV